MRVSYDLYYEKVMSFFNDKFSGDESEAGWEVCKSHVARHHMEYEVFGMAYQKLNKDSSVQECLDMIACQLDEWDL